LLAAAISNSVIRVPKLEMHLAYACNLRCEQCSHFSNYGFGEVLTLEEGSAWLGNWAARIEPVHFSFLGGEPLLNPKVPDFLSLARRLWPYTHIRLITNGLLLPRCSVEFWRALSKTETTLTISIHSRRADYLKQLHCALGVLSLRATQHGFRFELRNSIDGWYRLYRGKGADMLPFDDQAPNSSWAACRSKHCVTLEKNALWKCPPLAHLSRVAAKFDLARKPAWRIPLSYTPLTLAATDDEIRDFIGRQAEPACGMCPAKLEFFEKTIDR
jgi:hypothetical protein